MSELAIEIPALPEGIHWYILLNLGNHACKKCGAILPVTTSGSDMIAHTVSHKHTVLILAMSDEERTLDKYLNPMPWDGRIPEHYQINQDEVQFSYGKHHPDIIKPLLRRTRQEEGWDKRQLEIAKWWRQSDASIEEILLLLIRDADLDEVKLILSMIEDGSLHPDEPASQIAA